MQSLSESWLTSEQELISYHWLCCYPWEGTTFQEFPEVAFVDRRVIPKKMQQWAISSQHSLPGKEALDRVPTMSTILGSFVLYIKFSTSKQILHKSS